MKKTLILLALACLLAPDSATAQDQTGTEGQEPSTVTTYEVPLKHSRGRSSVAVPARTDNGEWNGTWIYVNRDYNFALWLSEQDGKPIAKLRFKGNGNLVEAFETDWEGHADYTVQGYPASFDFVMGNANENTFEASWDWLLDFRGSARREKGVIEAFRAGDGRQLVMHFTEFEKVIESRSGDKRYVSPQAWTFRKLSKRLVLWEELPF